MSHPATVPPPAFRLAMVDVDGTLRSPEGWLAGAVELLQALDDAGMSVALCSGRPVHSLEELVADLPMVRHLAGAGGSVVERRTADGGWATLLERHLPASDVQRALDACQRLDLEVWAYTGTQWLVTEVTPRVEREVAILGGSQPTAVDTFTGRDDLLKLLTLPTRDDQPEALASALDEADVAIVASSDGYLDVVPAASQLTKGGDALVHDLGIDWSAVVAIGDGPNDVGMVGLAGLGICLPRLTADAVHAANPRTQHRVEEATDRFEIIDLLPQWLG